MPAGLLRPLSIPTRCPIWLFEQGHVIPGPSTAAGLPRPPSIPDSISLSPHALPGWRRTGLAGRSCHGDTLGPLARSSLGAPRPPARCHSHHTCPHFIAGSGLGDMPHPDQLPDLPTFTPTGSPGLDMLASAGSHHHTDKGLQPASGDGAAVSQSLHSKGPYNPAATLPPKVVKKLLSLEFVEMAELRADIWPEDPTPAEANNAPRRPGKPPVTSIRLWLECYGRMAAVLTWRFPEKAAELWAYQTTILHAAHTYEGANWVAYDRLYRREMLAKKDLNWSVPNPRLYSEAFTGRAKRHPQCPHCLSEDHVAASCPHNPNPPIMGWFQGTPQLQLGLAASQLQPSLASLPKPTNQQEVCRNFNANRCRFIRCRYSHICSECLGPHAAFHCPQRQAALTNRGVPGWSRVPSQPRPGRTHPYLPSSSNQGTGQH